MCLVGDYFHDPPKEMTLDKFKVIAGNMRLERFDNVMLSGAGEPLINPHTLPIISYLNAEYPRVKVFLITNGIALTRELSGQLIHNNVSLLSFSVNAGTAAVYQRTMQVDAFDRVVENIRYYQELAKLTGKLEHVWMSFIAQRKNIEDLPNFVRLAHGLGVRLLVVRYARFYPRAQRLRLALTGEAFLEDTDSLFYHQELSDKYFREARDLCRQWGMHFGNDNDPLFSEPVLVRKCHFPFTDILVGMDGEVFTCCGGEVLFKRKVASGEYDFGNLLKQKLEDFWGNDLWKAMRQSAANPNGVSIPECQTCGEQTMWRGHLKKCHILELEGK